MEIKIDDKFMSCFVKENFLFLVWKKDTKSMNDEDFKKEALKFIGVVKDTNSKKIVVDMRDFSYSLSSDLISWRNKHIISVYNEIGVEKFAFISLKPTVNQDNPNNTFVTKTFTDEKEAVDWLGLQGHF